MKNKITLGVVAASFTALSMLSGCSAYGTAESDSNSTSTSSSFSMTAADGYIVRLNTAATITCGNMTYSTDTNVSTPNGKLIFNGLTDAAGCTINVPANAIVDSDGDNIYTSADENNSLNYEMKADGNDTIISQFTTLVQDYIAQGQSAQATALRAVVKDYNPVTSIVNAASDDNATRAESIQLIVLGEAIKVMKKTGASSSASAELNATTTLNLIENNSTESNITSITSGVTLQSAIDAIDAKCEIIDTIATALKTIVDSNPGQSTDITQVLIAISDGGATATDALNDATTNTAGDSVSFNVTVPDLNLTVLDGNISDAAAAIETAISNTPALLTLGSTLKLGNVSVALSSTGTFTTDLDVSSTSTLADFSKIVLPSATITKGFPQQSFTMTTTITDKSNSSNTVVAVLGSVKLDSSDDNTSVEVTIPANTTVAVTDNANNGSFSLDTGSADKINTDLSFDVCGLVDCTSSQLNDLNADLKVENKSYDINITLNPVSPDGNLTVDYLTITGVITTK